MDLFLIYFVCFGVGLVFTIMSALVGQMFGGHDGADAPGADGHAEAGFGTSDMPGFSAISPTTIATFLTAFGGLGMIFAKLEATRSPWISAPLAAMGGLAIAGAVMMGFRAVFKATQSSSESQVGRLVGAEAMVLSPIPAGGFGEIAYVHGGSRYTAPARAEDGQPIANGAPVKITRIVGMQFYVMPVKLSVETAGVSEP